MIADRLALGRLDPYWQRSRVWWSERSLREQVLFGALLSVAIFTLLLIGIIAPLRDLRQDAQMDIRNAALLEARLRAGGAGLGQTGTFRRGTASAIVTDSAAAGGITIQRMEPEGGNTRIVLADAPFEPVMRWIADLEQNSRLRVLEAQIERKGAPGIVSASIVVQE